jgi:hypothetical protein
MAFTAQLGELSLVGVLDMCVFAPLKHSLYFLGYTTLDKSVWRIVVFFPG